MAEIKDSANQKSQRAKFIQAARELGTDDDPERFRETVRKVAKAPPAKNAAHPRPAKGK
jgi:hypothetical protein